jgi:hypothetical protein
MANHTLFQSTRIYDHKSAYYMNSMTLNMADVPM